MSLIPQGAVSYDSPQEVSGGWGWSNPEHRVFGTSAEERPPPSAQPGVLPEGWFPVRREVGIGARDLQTLESLARRQARGAAVVRTLQRPGAATPRAPVEPDAARSEASQGGRYEPYRHWCSQRLGLLGSTWPGWARSHVRRPVEAHCRRRGWLSQMHEMLARSSDVNDSWRTRDQIRTYLPTQSDPDRADGSG